MEIFPKRVRRRYTSNQTPIFCGRNYMTTNGGASWTPASDSSYNASARTYASVDVCVDATHPGPPYRSGGPLGVCHYDDPIVLFSSGTYYGWMSASIGYKYEGGFVNSGAPSFCPSVWLRSNSSAAALLNYSGDGVPSLGDISSQGATAWKKFRPGNPTADLGVFLGELRDVPRMLSGTAKFFRDLWRSMGGNRGSFGPKKVADAWLNTQFGWLPFISDLRKFYTAYVSLSDRLYRIKRDNGRWCKRGGSLPGDSYSEVLDESKTATKIFPSLNYYYFANPPVPGNYTLTGSYSRRVWFEGMFRYWIPDIGTPEWEYRAILDIFGAFPCPSLVWELTPWSWLADWFTNVGDVVANMSTGYAENLAAQYAYVMGTTQISTCWDTSLNTKQGVIHNSSGYTETYKHRVGASPFGFGLTSNDFSARQWSILAALGLSRLKFI